MIDYSTCYACGKPVAGVETFNEARGAVHYACARWEERESPGPARLAALQWEIDQLRGKIRRLERVKRAVAKMHAEWPRDATKRMLTVIQMAHDARRSQLAQPPGAQGVERVQQPPHQARRADEGDDA
jgi:hypothetical protein